MARNSTQTQTHTRTPTCSLIRWWMYPPPLILVQLFKNINRTTICYSTLHFCTNAHTTARPTVNLNVKSWNLATSITTNTVEAVQPTKQYHTWHYRNSCTICPSGSVQMFVSHSRYTKTNSLRIQTSCQHANVYFSHLSHAKKPFQLSRRTVISQLLIFSHNNLYAIIAPTANPHATYSHMFAFTTPHNYH